MNYFAAILYRILTQDLNKKISQIQYNAVSLPAKVTFSDGSYITYLYDASGSKLRTDYYIRPLTVVTPIASWDDAYSEAGNSEVVSEPETDVDADREDAAMASASSASVAAPNATGIVVPICLDHTYTEYCGNHIFENGLLTMTLIPGGYISYEGGDAETPSFHFYLCDHEGNNRVVTDINGNIEQVNDYTPFGVLMKNDFTATSTQRYKYNGKELDRMHGLDLYDYGARLYDAPLGRWHVMDPLCEKYYSWSPYVYCANNPLKFVDPDGKEPRGLGDSRLIPAIIGTKVIGYLMETYATESTLKSIGFAINHPIIALNVNHPIVKGSISHDAYSLANELSSNSSYKNAIRHVLWQAMITQKYGESNAKRIGDCHEDTLQSTSSSILFSTEKETDTFVDKLNNGIGRSVGLANPKANNKELARIVVDKFFKEGLYVVEQRNGYYVPVMQKITQQEYDQAIKKINAMK